MHVCMSKYLTLAFFFCGYLIHAQTITVVDEISGEPVQFATVIGINPQVSSITNTKGQFDLSPYIECDSIAIQEVGHKSKVLSLDQVSALSNGLLLLSPNAFSLEGITISAARWEQNKSDIPYKITTIDPDQIKFENPQTAADLLETSGEVYVQKSQMGGGSPMIRGFAANRVMISVDGVRMNNAIFRSGNLQNVISLDPMAIENTEVVYGPGSVIYGSDALGGVMSFYTLTPQFSETKESVATGRAMVRASSANRERTGHLDFNLGYQKIAFITSISCSDFEDLQMGRNGPDDYLRNEYVIREDSTDRMVANPRPREQVSTEYDQINVTQKIRYQPNKNWEVTYGGHYSNTSDYGRYDRQIRYRGDTLRSAEWYYGPQEWMMHSLRVIHDGDNLLYDKMSITSAYQMFRESRHDRDFGSIRRSNRVERVYAPSLNIDFEQDIGDKHEIFYGAEGVFNLVHSNATTTNILTQVNSLNQTRYPHNSTWWSAAAYLSDKYHVSKKVTFVSSVRYSLIGLDATFDTTFISLPVQSVSIRTGALNGSTGLTYRPTDKWQMNVALSTGFRAPNIDDVGKVFDSEPGAVVIPNPALRSEYAYSGEVGAAKIFGERIKVDATLFCTWLNNAMVRRNSTLNGADSVMYGGELSQVQSIQNAAQATICGIQTGFELKLWKHITVNGRFNYQNGVEELDDGSQAPSRHVPPIFGQAEMTYNNNKFRASLISQFNGEVSYENLAPSERSKDFIYAADDNGNPYSPAWAIIDAHASYQIKTNFSVTASIENILDLRYRPYSSGISAPGRNFIGTVNYTF